MAFTATPGTTNAQAGNTVPGFGSALAPAAVGVTPEVAGAGWQAIPPASATIYSLCDTTTALQTTVGCVLEKVALSCGLIPTQFDFSAVQTTSYQIDGFIISERRGGKEVVEELLRIYDVDLIEIDGKLKALPRGGSSSYTIPEDDLGAHEYNGDSEPVTKVVVRRTMDLEIPREADLSYWSKTNTYQQANQRAMRYTKGHAELLTFSVPVVLTDNKARQVIERILYRMWLEREQFQFSLLPKWMILAPGDIVTVPVFGINTRVRILSVETAGYGPITVNAVLDDPQVITQEQAGAVTPTGVALGTIATTTSLIAWSTNGLRDADVDSVGFYYVVSGPSGQDWPGCVLYLSRDGGSNFTPVDETADPGIHGVTTTALAAGSTTGLFDYSNTVDVQMTVGVPIASTELAVLNGANAAMLGDEMIQFVTVTSLGGNSYRLGGLLRGRRGTNNYWGTHVIGEKFILLDNGGFTRRVEVSEDLISKPVILRAVTSGQSLASASNTNLTITGNEYKPYDGTDGVGQRNVPASNDWTITWKRRTRCGGSWADLADAALCETSEAYEAEIWDTGFTTLKRTKTGLTSPSFVYASAEQTTDFGSPQSTFGIRVFQIGRIGRGYTYQFTVSG